MSMSYKIIADSCCEFPEKYREDSRFERIALGLEVGGELIMDDESFDQGDRKSTRLNSSHMA